MKRQAVSFLGDKPHHEKRSNSFVRNSRLIPSVLELSTNMTNAVKATKSPPQSYIASIGPEASLTMSA
jgi:hypothetical protein